MSFSFNVTAKDKAAAKEAVRAEFEKVLQYQPDHEYDKALVFATADAYIDLIVDDDTMDVTVSVNGSLGWRHGTEPHEYTSSNVGVSVWYTTRAAVV
jgi:hypothetical protein